MALWGGGSRLRMVLPNARYGFCSRFSFALIAAVFALCVLYTV
jgi:hypothetical protein